MKPLIAPISHSPLSLLVVFHIDPQDQPCVHIIQNNRFFDILIEWDLTENEEVFCTISLLYSKDKHNKSTVRKKYFKGAKIIVVP